MAEFDIETAVPVLERSDGQYESPSFDVSSAFKIDNTQIKDTAFDFLVRHNLDAVSKEEILKPITDEEAQTFIAETPSAADQLIGRTEASIKNIADKARPFLAPYAYNTVGFFTRPFGYDPNLNKPFGLSKGTSVSTQEELGKLKKESPGAFALGEVVGGMAPFLVTAPLFPESLLGTIGTFETVGIVGEIGHQETQESLLKPQEEKDIDMLKVVGKNAILGPIWHYSKDLEFIGRPFMSTMARAGVRGVGTGTLEAIFGTDLAEAVRQGGLMTALSLMFEVPALGATALGRGVLARVNKLAQDYTGDSSIHIDPINMKAYDEASAKAGIFKMAKIMYNAMRGKIERVIGNESGYAMLPGGGKTEGKPFKYTKWESESDLTEKLATFAKEAPAQEFKKIAIANANLPEIKAIKDATGIDTSGYFHTLDNYAANHIINKHGKDSIPVTPEDFKLIPRIIKFPDQVRYAHKTEGGKPGVMYMKRFNGTTYYIEEVREKRGELNTVTMYKRKTRPLSDEQMEAETSFPPTAEPSSGFASTINIPQGKRQVKAYAPKKVETFYHTLPEVIDSKMPSRTTPQQVLGIINSNGVSPEEVKYSGIEKYLEDKEQANKSDVLEYLKRNQVQVEEVVKSGPVRTFDKAEAKRLFLKGLEVYGIDFEGIESLIERSDEIDNYDRFTLDEDFTEGDRPKFEKYQLPGGENYREVLIKAPSKSGLSSQEEEALIQLRRDVEDKNILPEGAKMLAELETKAGKGASTFRSSHWDEPNILVHIRMNDHFTPDGKKVLFIEELQSDWARKGRQEGFVENQHKTPTVREDENVWVVHFPNGTFTDISKTTAKTAEEALAYATSGKPIKIIQGVQKGVPSHPLLKNWVELALKRVLRIAAEEGYDYVAWINGTQTADRYDLSKQIDTLKWAHNSDGSYWVGTYREDKVIFEGVVSAKDLPDYAGKEIASKIEHSKKIADLLSGIDLRLGGEWAKNLYDKMIPKFLEKYTKRWGGKIENIQLKSPTPKIKGVKSVSETQQGLSITPEMHDALLYEGQPLFGRGGVLRSKDGSKYLYGMKEEHGAEWEYLGDEFILKKDITVYDRWDKKKKTFKAGDALTVNNIRMNNKTMKYEWHIQDGDDVWVTLESVDKIAEASKPIEIMPPKERREGPRTITGEIIKRGGLDSKKLSKDYNIQELREFGLGHIFRKGGRTLDDMAESLIEEGLLQVPEQYNPADYLMEVIKDKNLRQIAHEDDLTKEYLKKVKKEGKKEEDISFDVFGMEKEATQEYQDRLKDIFKAAERKAVLRNRDVLKIIEEVTGISDALLPPIVRGGLTPPILEFGKWTDAWSLALSRETLERNIEKVAGTDAEKVKEFTTEIIKKNETARAEFITLLREQIAKKMLDLGIEYKSVDDILVQRYGEGRIDLNDLKTTAAPNRWEQIKEAAEYFRNIYDDLLDTINKQREDYGYTPIPKRKDYFRHYQEIGATIDFFGIFANENSLPTEISGITHIFKPGKPFTNVELQRMGGNFTESAIGGIDNYLDSASKQMFHIDSVQRVRALEKYIRISGEEGIAYLPNFVANLTEYGNLLAGKKALWDRGAETLGGRAIYKLVAKAKKYTGANMIAGNISSALTNFIPFTQSFATMSKTAAIKGILESTTSPFNAYNYKIDGVKSDLFGRRYPINDISMTTKEKGVEALNAMFRLIDMFTAKAILAGKFYDGIEKGLSPQEAMKQADDYTARILADRSWGQLPNIFGIRVFSPWTQFQTEVNNMFSFVKHDIPHQYKGDVLKIISAILQFTVYSYLFNNLYEWITGRRPTIDLIHAALILLGWDQAGQGRPLGKRGWVAFNDLRENLPFGSVVGGRLPVMAGIPNIEAIMKGQKSLPEELLKMVFLLNPIGGGMQAKKTIEGLMDYARGQTLTKPRKNQYGRIVGRGKVKYRINKGVTNLVRGIFFGKNAFPEALKYRETRGMKKGARP